MIQITVGLLRAAIGCTAERAALFAQHLTDACEHFGINTPARLAAFLAQLGHESGGLRYVRELASGEAYEGRRDLGNTQSGDGARYRGRGLIQITGRFNYRAAVKQLRELDAPDFEDSPEALEEPKWAAWSAAGYWDSRELNALADVGQFEAITRRINGGLNGQADRLARWERAKAALAVADVPAAPDQPFPAGEATQETGMSFGDVVKNPATSSLLSLVNPLLGLVPQIASIFLDKEGTTVPQRNVAAAVAVADAAQKALVAAGKPADNMQQVFETITSDPEARDIARSAILADCGHLVESGGGGIDGARKADVATQTTGDIRKSASFWIALLLLPLVYLLVLSLIGMIGTAQWSDDVRAGLSGSLISAIVGGLVGYYYGQTTSRNRAPKE